MGRQRLRYHRHGHSQLDRARATLPGRSHGSSPSLGSTGTARAGHGSETPPALPTEPSRSNGPRSLPDDLWNSVPSCVAGSVLDCGADDSADCPGHGVPSCRPDTLGDHGRRTPGGDGGDGPAEDVRHNAVRSSPDCLPSYLPDCRLLSAVYYLGNRPPGGGGSLGGSSIKP